MARQPGLLGRREGTSGAVGAESVAEQDGADDQHGPARDGQHQQGEDRKPHLVGQQEWPAPVPVADGANDEPEEPAGQGAHGEQRANGRGLPVQRAQVEHESRPSGRPGPRYAGHGPRPGRARRDPAGASRPADRGAGRGMRPPQPPLPPPAPRPGRSPCPWPWSLPPARPDGRVTQVPADPPSGRTPTASGPPPRRPSGTPLHARADAPPVVRGDTSSCSASAEGQSYERPASPRMGARPGRSSPRASPFPLRAGGRGQLGQLVT